MVPHDASHLYDDDEDDTEMSLLNDYGYPYKARPSDEATEGSTGSEDNVRRRPTTNDLEFKPEIDTGDVSDSCFSFRKLWKYTGPGKTDVEFNICTEHAANDPYFFLILSRVVNVSDSHNLG